MADVKILYINSPECDYMQDLLYSGLVKVLGSQNIYDYPLNRRYHWVQKKYPRNLGFQGGWEGWLRLFRNFEPKDFELVIVGSCKHLALQSYVEIQKKIPSSVPVILIDGGDRPGLGEDLVHNRSPYTLDLIESQVRPFDFIFKREYLLTASLPSRVKPLPFCMNMDKLPRTFDRNKKYDVSFWAVESHPSRTKALEILETRFDCEKNGTIRDQKFHKYSRKGKFYLEEIARCKVVINIRGCGWDTMRYWEVPAMDTFMITQKPQILIPNDFRNGVEVVYCQDDLSDLVDLCEHYLKNDEKREKIAQASYKRLLEYHTDVHRARYILNFFIPGNRSI